MMDFYILTCLANSLGTLSGHDDKKNLAVETARIFYFNPLNNLRGLAPLILSYFIYEIMDTKDFN